MKETKLNNCINELKTLAKKYQLTPQQYRYVVKRVREGLNLKTINRKKPLPKFLNAAEVYRLIEVGYKQHTTDGLLIEFMIYTGLRISETKNLLIDNIDPDNNQLLVREGKGGKDRHVPISNNLLSKINMYLQGRKHGYLFTKKNGKEYSVRALQHKIEKAIKACNFEKPGLSTHSLRHTFACMCLSKGLRLEDIQLLMGHSSRVTTEIYAKLELGSVKEQYLQLMGGTQ